jgi:NAD(P)H-dependent flavin oxidoreductase YrpB (nitropropane dioxygenase family)
MARIRRRQLLQLLGYGSLGLAIAPARSQGKRRDRLTTPLTEDYGLRYPIVGAGMGFYALPELVAAISNAGALGVLGAAPAPPPALRVLIRHIQGLTDKPFAVDLVNTLLFGGTVPAVTDDHITVLVEEGVKIVVFFWDTPQAAWVQRLQDAGVQVWMQVGSLAGAYAAVAVGIDVLIAQGSEAGGHNRNAYEGSTTPRATLVAQIIETIAPRLVLAAGGIADGLGLATALLEGADGAWVGTRFATARESYAHDEYKRRVLQATATDTVITTLFGPEWCPAHGQAIVNRIVTAFAGGGPGFVEGGCPPPSSEIIGQTSLFGQPYAMPKFSAILPTRETTGDFEEMWLAAGGVSAALIREVKPAAQIIAHMVAEARQILKG